MENRTAGADSDSSPADELDPHRLARSVYSVARGHGTVTLRFLDVGVVMSAWILAYYAGFSGEVPFTTRTWIPFLLLPLVTQLLCNQFAGLYGPVWRYASVEEAGRVVVAVVSGAFITAMELAWVESIHSTTMPLFSAPPIAALLMLLGCGGIRFQARLFALERQRSDELNRLRTLIVGATDEGLAIALEVGRRAYTDGVIIGFVDDQQTLVGRSLAGTRVLGTPDDLELICERERIERILIALPNAPREHVRALVTRALATDAQVKLLPTGINEGGSLLASLRDLDLTDLLGREHAPVDTSDIAHYVTGSVVLVTGAGGSIGSEIARQVRRFGPERLLVLDRDESLLFETASELPDAVPLLADITDAKRLREIFTEYRPDVVFHAAAHKHVPILESHAAEAVRNNVLATLTLAREAARQRCRLVHISTDKAADPCSVMGATKRAAELVVLAVGTEHGLPFAAVRFGNVLGSRGSVVPTFFRQIIEGGPVTVTDPEMTRYFMTIPEAVSLVLQAGSMAEHRRVFLLEMGDPVRILDLANQMIRLAGMRPGQDIEIEIVGTRPGERTHERLHDDGEIVGTTDHPAIRGLSPRQTLDLPSIHSSLDLLERQCVLGDDHAAVLLLDAMLRDAGVPCHLEENMQVELDSLTTATDPTTDVVIDGELIAAPLVRDHRPAVLGGGAAFPEPLPLVNPPRPVLDRVMNRLAPSYNRGVLTNGPLVAELEERAAERLGVARAVAVSSCTSGLMLAVQAVTDGARSGAVLLPSFTFSASAHAVAWNGLTPRFVECTPDGFQVDPDALAALIGDDGVRAILATHVFGAPCAPDRVEAVGASRGIPIVFDAAHAFGAVAAGRRVGGFGAAEVFSLTPTKVLVAGEGGIVATNDSALADTLRIGRDYGNPGDYDTRFVGLNARMSEFHAAMALTSLEALEENLERRRDIADRYRSALAGIPGIGFQVVDPADVSTYKDFTITVDAEAFGCTRDVLARALSAEGIDTRKYFSPPVHRQRAYASLPEIHLPVTDSVSARVLSLPIFPALGDGDLERVAGAVAAIGAHGAEVTTRLVGEGRSVPNAFDRD